MKNIFPVLFTLLSLSSIAQEAERGYIDIRSNLENAKTTTLDGVWEFYWNQLLESGQFSEKNPEYVYFPSLWSSLGDSISNNGSSIGYATYRLRVKLDPEKKYAIYTPAVYNSYKFFINGTLISQNGEVGTDKESTRPFWSQITVPIDGTILKDTNEFVIQVANFHHRRGGPVDQIVIGDQEEFLQSRSILAVLDTLLTGALIMGGLFFLGLYIFGRQQKSVLYFSVFCIVFSYYVIGSGNYVLHSLLPWLPWNITTRIEFATVYLISILLVKFTEYIYPDETPSKLVNAIVIVSYIYIAFAIFLPVPIFTMLHLYYLAVVLCILVFGYYVYIMAAIHKRVGSLYSLIGATFLIAVLIMRVLNALDIMHLPVYLVPLGYMVFFFLHSLTLSQQFAVAWKKAKDDAVLALKAKSDFLSTMSHEIRTPMNAVIGLTNHLIDDNPKDTHKDALSTLKFSAQNLLVLINDILDFSKIEANKIEFDYHPVSLSKLSENLTKVFEPIANEKGLELKYAFDQNVPSMVHCDPTRTAQVLTNLIGNAIKFTKEGSVTIGVELLEVNNNVAVVKMSVTDTGIGIAEEKLNAIFESFTQASTSTTREFGGTGLGLSISKKLLELQGVQLQVESELGKGSSFYFIQYFKVAEEVAPAAPVEKMKPGEKIDANILLVEDNEVNVMVAMKFLSKWGINTEVARNGEEGLTMVGDKEVDLVLMDLQMPVMDGYTAAREIRKTGNNIPIIALTASAMLNERQKIYDAGMNDFVLKPFDPELLFETIKKHLSN